MYDLILENQLIKCHNYAVKIKYNHIRQCTKSTASIMNSVRYIKQCVHVILYNTFNTLYYTDGVLIVQLS